jgi:cardiolipin synthase C
VRVLTNSLAATGEPSVHAGYRRYRRQLLEKGVEIYELSPSLTVKVHRLGRFGSSLGMLHMKICIIDGTRFFVGSMNLDTRSERYNTELGVLIESPPLAQSYIDLIRFEGSAYRLKLDPVSGEIQWVEETAPMSVSTTLSPKQHGGYAPSHCCSETWSLRAGFNLGMTANMR